MKVLFASLLIFLSSFYAFAQFKIEGKIKDEATLSPQIGVIVLLINPLDSSKRQATISDTSGVFLFNNIAEGNYRIKTEFLGYKNFERLIKVQKENINLGDITLTTDATTLKEVKIEGLEVRSKQKGDTTEYNAKAFKVNPDANAQDLITKMPGVTIEGGAVKTQGEDVKKILVDGKEFFGNDVQMALRNLPADAIDKIQVFDRMNEQSRLTGFNDGNTEKSINITTKPGMGNGKFGRLYAGYGTDNRFSLGGNYNSFDKNRRISLLGQSNNINQQNFSSQDLAGISSTGGGGGMGMGRGGPGGGGGMGRGGPGGGGPANNFMTGQQGGINYTNAFGINYTESIGKKLNLAASYFFNQTQNTTEGIVKRLYYLPNGSNQHFDQNNLNINNSYNHRFNGRIEYNLDSNNSLTITPQLSYQKNDAENLTIGKTTRADGGFLNSTNNTLKNNNLAINFNNNILFNHKFAKLGRSYAVNIGTTINDRDGNNTLTGNNTFLKNSSDSIVLLNQEAITNTKGINLSTNLSYSEPVGKNGAIQISYLPSMNKNNSSQITNRLDSLTQLYSKIDTNLSNDFKNNILIQAAGLAYRYKGKKSNFNLGANVQSLHLSSEATFPKSISIDKYFENILPTAMYQYSFENKANLRLFYRTQTNAPSVTQLQNVINNSNPLALVAGNPNLVQEYNHFMMMRYNISNIEKGRTFFIFAGGGGTANYIANASFVSNSDSLLEQGIILSRGAQLSKPVNLDGFRNFRSFINYSMPIKPIKCNLNLNGSYNFTQTPGLINKVANKVQNHNINGTIGLGSNISQKIDFNISYNPNYTIINNSLQPQLNNNFYLAYTNLRANYLPWKGLVMSGEVIHTIYTGLGQAFNQNFWLCNASIGYKFLKGQLADIRLSVYDLLDQNNSAGRIVTEAYTEDNRTMVLRRYFMLTFTYNIKKFGANPAPKEKQ